MSPRTEFMKAYLQAVMRWKRFLNDDNAKEIVPYIQALGILTSCVVIQDDEVIKTCHHFLFDDTQTIYPEATPKVMTDFLHKLQRV
jgi:hypothetical protein